MQFASDLNFLTGKCSHYFCEYSAPMAKCAVKRVTGVLNEYWTRGWPGIFD